MGWKEDESFYIAWKPFHIHWMMHLKFYGFPYPMIWIFVSPFVVDFGHHVDHGDDELFAELFNRDETYLPNTSLISQDIAEQRIKIGKITNL